METAFYGRTGLLPSNREGLPVQKPRLLHGSTTAELKWSPSLLTVPQLVLHHIVHNGEAIDDPGFSTFLRVSAIAEAVRSAWPCRQPAPAAALRRRRCGLAQAVLTWAAAKRAAEPRLYPPHRTDWYLPSLTLLTTKEGSVLARLPAVSERAVTLLGKDHTINDIALDHPSCSSQHAALQVQFVYAEQAALVEEISHAVPKGTYGDALAALWSAAEREDPATLMASSASTLPTGAVGYTLFDALWSRLLEVEAEAEDFASLWTLELQIVDLNSTNGSWVNGEKLEPYTPTNLIGGDVLTFGASTRQYVLLRGT